MPGQNAGSCTVQAIRKADGVILRVSWETASTGVMRAYLGHLSGVLSRLDCVHKTTGASGTYKVELFNESESDLLNGQFATLTVNQTSSLRNVEDDTTTGMESRPVRLAGPTWLVITNTAVAVQYGTLDIHIIQEAA